MKRSDEMIVDGIQFIEKPNKYLVKVHPVVPFEGTLDKERDAGFRECYEFWIPKDDKTVGDLRVGHKFIVEYHHASGEKPRKYKDKDGKDKDGDFPHEIYQWIAAKPVAATKAA